MTDAPNTQDPWGLLAVGLGVLSWLGCCVGSCLGMGYLGPLVAVGAVGAVMVGWSRPEANRGLLMAGLALSVSNIVLFVLMVASVMLSLFGIVVLDATS